MFDPRGLDTDARIKAAAPAASTLAPTGVPSLVQSLAALRDHPLDHRSGFIASLIDGRYDVEAIVDMSGMPHDEVVAILAELVERGVIAMR
jgi:hypothetical protein